ncbi:hypothetical protein [Enterovirga sp.]|uniref:alginate O-acetyltransferase AlgX-related protein n=1 Tax=Enterovirga sp. TaxID=2026350 RepID=UPI002CC3ABAC|nr:hypothetical protein [Enterovirga sp.]HMO29447.1 hypothetical protein [Enterovirga sp.]
MIYDVHVGEEGWLFLTGGANPPIRMYRRGIGRSLLLRRWAWLLAMRARRCRRRGIRYLHLPVPEKLSVYADKAPALAIDPSLGSGQQLCRLIGNEQLCLDAVEPLVAARAGGETFLRTDSHWSSEGCRVAHDTICRTLGAPIRWQLEDRHCVVVEDFVGDLGVKLTPAPAELLRRRTVTRDAVRIAANELVQRYEQAGKAADLHRGARVVYRNEAADADPRRLLLFGDSFSAFDHHGLSAMLAETFREVHFIWSSAIDWGYVDRVHPDLVLTELAERFMIWVPSDLDYDNEAFAGDRLRELDQAGPA